MGRSGSVGLLRARQARALLQHVQPVGAAEDVCYNSCSTFRLSITAKCLVDTMTAAQSKRSLAKATHGEPLLQYQHC